MCFHMSAYISYGAVRSGAAFVFAIISIDMFLTCVWIYIFDCDSRMRSCTIFRYCLILLLMNSHVNFVRVNCVPINTHQCSMCVRVPIMTSNNITMHKNILPAWIFFHYPSTLSFSLFDNKYKINLISKFVEFIVRNVNLFIIHNVNFQHTKRNTRSMFSHWHTEKYTHTHSKI